MVWNRESVLLGGDSHDIGDVKIPEVIFLTSKFGMGPSRWVKENAGRVRVKGVLVS